MHYEFLDRLHKIVVVEGKDANQFTKLFTYKDELNFWVVETLSNHSATIVGCVGVTHLELDNMNPNKHQYLLMKTRGIRSCFELKVSSALVILYSIC